MSPPARRAAGALLLALVLAACGGDDGSSETSAVPGTTERAPTPSDAAATRVELDEFAFRPSDVTVERGTAVEAVNVGSAPHNLTVERGGGREEAGEELVASKTFGGGKRETVEVDVAAGRYTLVCTVPGHREAGMVGTITVR